MPELTILKTYTTPGAGPTGLAWDGRLLWNADYTTGTIFGFDPATGDTVRTLSCPGNLSGLTWDGRALWQSLHDGGTLRRINPETNDFDQTIMVAEHGWLSGLAWDGRYLWAASQQHGKLFAIDRDSGQVVRTLAAPVAAGGLAYLDGSLWLGVPDQMVFNETYQHFDWAGDEHRFAVLQLDAADGRQVARYTLQFLPMGLAWINEELWLIQTGERKLHHALLTPGYGP